jgi:NhaP-type Na+/H+ or K+/H+ antiporter
VPKELFLLGAALVVAVLLGRLLAGRLGIPDAAAYVLIGVGAGLVPELPAPGLSPDVVLLVFLPPLVYYAAFFSDPRQTLEHVVAVVGQSVGLVLATTVAAGGALLLIFPDLGWAAALAFGAAIAPPDPVAATTVLQRLGVPGRLVTVLEGEGLINDGVALTVFGIAVANMGGAPTTSGILLGIVVEVAGGIGFGLLVGIAVAWLRERTRDSLGQVVWSLTTPFLAFVPASLAHASGVLATVTAAVWLGVRARGVVAPSARLQTETFWRVLNLLLVAFLFVLLGMQVPGIVRAVHSYLLGPLVLASVAVIVVVVVVRMAWAVLLPELVRWVVAPRRATRTARSERRPDPTERTAGESDSGSGADRARVRRLHQVRRLLPDGIEIGVLSGRERVALGWCGPRGAVSLAVALSLPLTTPDGAPFVRRDLLIFLTMVVVLATLVGQVVPLPAVLRWLGLRPDERERTEGLRARRAMVDAALRELDEVAVCERSERDEPPGLEPLRQVLELRRDRLIRQLETESDGAQDGDGTPDGTPDERQLRLRLLNAERAALRELSARGEIGRRTMLAISQELDLDETRLLRPR